MTKKSSRPATEAELAALRFEPWPELAGPISEETLLSELSSDHVSAHLVTCRLAVLTMYKTKAELAVILGEADNDFGRAYMENFIDAKDFFTRFAMLLAAAEARILVAGSSYLQGAKAADRELRKIGLGR